MRGNSAGTGGPVRVKAKLGDIRPRDNRFTMP